MAPHLGIGVATDSGIMDGSEFEGVYEAHVILTPGVCGRKGPSSSCTTTSSGKFRAPSASGLPKANSGLTVANSGAKGRPKRCPGPLKGSQREPTGQNSVHKQICSMRNAQRRANQRESKQGTRNTEIVFVRTKVNFDLYTVKVTVSRTQLLRIIVDMVVAPVARWSKHFQELPKKSDRENHGEQCSTSVCTEFLCASCRHNHLSRWTAF